MAESAVSTVTIIDTSGSMTKLGFVANTVISSKAFVSEALAGDSIGVVSYDEAAKISYPLTEVGQGNAVRKEASEAIQKLEFYGRATNIAAGIQKAREIIGPAGKQRGMVLLSDGGHNRGTDPLTVLPTGYPIYTCLMGSVNLKMMTLMEQIAVKTGGKPYFAVGPVKMAEIYNQIASRSSGSALLANDHKKVSPMDFMVAKATVSANNRLAQFSIVWTDPDCTYTDSQNPSSTQLSIVLFDPGNNAIETPPSVVGSGYVIFNLEQPRAGRWSVQVIFVGRSQSLEVTVGVLEHRLDAASATPRLEVEIPTRAAAAQPFTVEARLTEGGEPLTGQNVELEVERPGISFEDALKLYEPQLATAGLDAAPDGEPSETAALEALQQKLGEGTDLLQYRRFPLVCHEAAPGLYRATVPPGAAGGLNLRWRVQGRSERTGSFDRVHLASVLVE